jgi:hypothetical protein
MLALRFRARAQLLKPESLAEQLEAAAQDAERQSVAALDNIQTDLEGAVYARCLAPPAHAVCADPTSACACVQTRAPSSAQDLPLTHGAPRTPG